MAAHPDLLHERVGSIAIEITSRCNLRCAYCYKSDHVLDALPGANEDMTDAMIAELYHYCKESGIRAVTLSLIGETTMTAGWHRRIGQFLDDPEMDTYLVSNFVRPFTDGDLEALTKIRNLQVSFDSARLDVVRKMRSRADLRTITYNMVRLRQKGRDLGRMPFVLVNCTICRSNIGDIAALAGFCRELGVDQLMLGEVMNLGLNTADMPETLDSLSEDEIILLAKEIMAAEDALRDSPTALRMRDHLGARIGDIIEHLREGMAPVDARGYFHRPMRYAGCRQPWTAPIVRADGSMFPCCGALPAGPTIGNLNTSSMSEILDGESARAVRASILEGRPTVHCEDCGFGQAVSLPEFVGDIEELQGGTSSLASASDVARVNWPNLLGSSEHPVVIENTSATFADGSSFLVENEMHGLHRVLIDFGCTRYSEITFQARPAGRRRLRLDIAKDATMIGRAHFALLSRPKLNVTIGSMRCAVTPLQDRWYEIVARFPTPEPLSQINLTLMREDEAVSYTGDGQSGLVIRNLTLGCG